MPFKTTLITGATSGIGKETALALAQKDHALYLLVRDLQKGAQLQEEILSSTGNKNIFVVECDLTDLASVRKAADELKSKLMAVNVLINNAGLIFQERELSKDGFEMTFALNHLGPFMLTMSLMPLLERGQARVINLSSEAHKPAKAEWLNDLQSEKKYSPFRAYALSKLLNIYFTKSLDEKYRQKGITSFALHPGVVKTGFGNSLTGFGEFIMWLAKPFMISPAKGAETSIYLATEPKLDQKSGKYFIKKKEAEPSKAAEDVQAREKLWDISMNLCQM